MASRTRSCRNRSSPGSASWSRPVSRPAASAPASSPGSRPASAARTSRRKRVPRTEAARTTARAVPVSSPTRAPASARTESGTIARAAAGSAPCLILGPASCRASSVTRNGFPALRSAMTPTRSGPAGAPVTPATTAATSSSASGCSEMTSPDRSSAVRMSSRPCQSRSPSRAVTSTAAGIVRRAGASSASSRSEDTSAWCASSITTRTGRFAAAAAKTSARSKDSCERAPSGSRPSPLRAGSARAARNGESAISRATVV